MCVSVCVFSQVTSNRPRRKSLLRHSIILYSVVHCRPLAVDEGTARRFTAIVFQTVLPPLTTKSSYTLKPTHSRLIRVFFVFFKNVFSSIDFPPERSKLDCRRLAKRKLAARAPQLKKRRQLERSAALW